MGTSRWLFHLIRAASKNVPCKSNAFFWTDGSHNHLVRCAEYFEFHLRLRTPSAVGPPWAFPCSIWNGANVICQTISSFPSNIRNFKSVSSKWQAPGHPCNFRRPRELCPGTCAIPWIYWWVWTTLPPAAKRSTCNVCSGLHKFVSP